MVIVIRVVNEGYTVTIHKCSYYNIKVIEAITTILDVSQEGNMDIHQNEFF